MSFDSIINLAYVIAATLFVFGIKMLGSAETARRGNMISGIGMLIAVVVTLLNKGMSYEWIVAGLIVGTLIGGISARLVKMTSMPELVALFNGFGDLRVYSWHGPNWRRSGGSDGRSIVWRWGLLHISAHLLSTWQCSLGESHLREACMLMASFLEGCLGKLKYFRGKKESML